VWEVTPVLAVLFSLPLALLATANSSHLAVHTVSRSNLCLLRAVPDLNVGLLFMAAVGIGALPRMLALVFYSTNILVEFFRD